MSSDVTTLLCEIRAGRRAPADLFPVVYDELHRIAHRLVRGERNDHTFSSTALIHEAYLRLVPDGQGDWCDRAHFLAAAAQAMRHILIDHARGKKRKKRGWRP